MPRGRLNLDRPRCEGGLRTPANGPGFHQHVIPVKLVFTAPEPSEGPRPLSPPRHVSACVCPADTGAQSAPLRDNHPSRHPPRNARACVCTSHTEAGAADGNARRVGRPLGIAPALGLPDVVHRFKTMMTRRHIDGVKQFGWPPFRGRPWQRNYYEHIRNQQSLNHVREYILTNPER